MKKIFQPQFIFPFSAFTISSLATQVFLFIVPIWLYDLTSKKEIVSLSTVVQSSSVVIFGIISGVIIDAASKRKITIWSSLLMFFICLIVLIAPKNNIFMFFALVICFVIASRFNSNAQNTAMFLKYRKNDNDLVTYNSYTSFLFTALGIIYPLIGATFYSYLKLNGIAIVIMLGSLLTAVIYLFWKDEEEITVPKNNNESKKVGFLTNLVEGFKYSFKDREVSRYLLTLALVMFSTSIFNSIFYVYIKDELHLSMKIYSYLYVANGLGGIFASLYLFPKLQKKNVESKKIIDISLIITALCLFLFVFRFSIFIYYGVEFLMGIFLTLAIMNLSIGIQKSCKPDYYSRVNSFRQTINNLCAALGGSIGFGFLVFASMNVIIVFSSIILLILAAMKFLIPSTKKIELNQDL
ncbi:MFS transporter [Bacillus sp. CH_442]|uniref:MFS transporter n=1 Tax=Bacillus sp. CH_442 TaxID=2978217 RepID=UPI0030F6A1C5